MFSETGPRSFPYQVEIFEDSIAEGSEELSVNLSSAVPGDKGVAYHRNAAQLKLMDDDSKEIIDYQLHSLCTVVRCVVHSCHCALHESSVDLGWGSQSLWGVSLERSMMVTVALYPAT